MRAVVYRRFGNPQDVLEVVDVPEPQNPRQGELLVRVMARAVQHGDLLGITGALQEPGAQTSLPAEGRTPGFEGAGVVETVGPGVSGWIAGDGVSFFPAPGAWAEKTLVPVTSATKVPAGVRQEIAAQLHVKPGTAASLFRAAKAAGAKPKDGAIILSAAGSVIARIVAYMAMKEGITVGMVVRSDAGASELTMQFQGALVASTQGANWSQSLATAMKAEPVRVVLDPVGGKLSGELMSLLAEGGSLISYGDLSGEPIIAPALAFSGRDLKIGGVSVGRWARLPAETRQEDIRRFLDIVLANPQIMPIAGTFDLSDVRSAAALVDKPGKIGAVVLTSY
jgi:NADPH:quinone reductase-like Zn-dependent oxidoreductase